MKNLYLRSAVALACAIGLAACGGDDDGTWPLQGAVQGVNMTGLVLQNNGGDDLVVPANASSFTFPKLIAVNDDFNITIKSSPSNATCSVVGAKGTANNYNGVGSIGVVCILVPHNVTGKISGNSTGDMVIINGADRLTVTANTSTFSMTRTGADGKTKIGTVGEGQPYGIQVLTPPPGLSCRVDNGTGTMGTTDVTNVQITCG